MAARDQQATRSSRGPLDGHAVEMTPAWELIAGDHDTAPRTTRRSHPTAEARRRIPAGAIDRGRIARYEARIAAYDARGAEFASAVDRPRAGVGRRAGPVRGGRRPSRATFAVRRTVALAILVLMSIGLISYASAMLAPSNVGFGVRSIEWLRDHGGAWLVSDIERLYYSVNSPARGGPALKSLPSVGLRGGGAESLYAPPPIAPAINPPLPGEGRWRPTGSPVNGAPPLLVTTFRPDPNYPRMVAGVAWLDRSRTSLQLYPGRYEPPSGSFRGPMEVPQRLRAQLLATFNSGFKLEDSGGGFAALGQLYAPLRDGLATLVGLRDGSVDVRAWTGGAQPGPSVLFARQNLPLIVQNGQLNPNLSDGSLWGATLGNAIRVWRSGLGIDARGNLLYAAADNQTAESLAQILQRAGAVRAMELDINSEWVTFNFYGAPGAGGPAKLLPGMSREATRYLEPDDRDFLAVFGRSGG
jgi:Phosphodiester glycosidase